MAKADALRAAEETLLTWRSGARREPAGLSGNAKMIAAPAYKKLLAAEP